MVTPMNSLSPSSLSRLFHTLLAAGTVAALASGVLTPAASAQTTVTISKVAGKSNPGIYVADFQGPAEMRDLLVRTLVQCDWFTVLPNASGAMYQVRAAYGESPTPYLDVQVSYGATGNLRFRQTSRNSQRGWVVYQAVDQILTRLFKVPGLCASSIAFANGARGYKEIFACNFDGSNAHSVTFNQTISTEPSWGPSAGSMVYTLYQKNCTDVVLIDMINRRHRPISQFPGLNSGASLSHDGQIAALTLSRDRKVELYLIRLRDRALQRLTNDSAVESSPCWSPDDTQICFVSDRGGHPNLYLMPSRGGQAQRLPTNTGEAVSPDWSPVSNKICFATKALGDYDLAVMDMGAGRSVELVTRGGGPWESPSWAPDGRHVVCTQAAGTKKRLCMVDTWSGKVTAITKAGDLSLPSWSPLSP